MGRLLLLLQLLLQVACGTEALGGGRLAGFKGSTSSTAYGQAGLRASKAKSTDGCALRVAVKTERRLANNETKVVRIKVANRGTRDISAVGVDFTSDPSVAYLSVKPNKHYNTTPGAHGPETVSWSGISLRYRESKVFKVRMRVDDCLPEAVQFSAAAFIMLPNNTKDCYVETFETAKTKKPLGWKSRQTSPDNSTLILTHLDDCPLALNVGYGRGGTHFEDFLTRLYVAATYDVSLLGDIAPCTFLGSASSFASTSSACNVTADINIFMSPSMTLGTVPFTSLEATDLCDLNTRKLETQLPRAPMYFFISATIYDGDLTIVCPSRVYTKATAYANGNQYNVYLGVGQTLSETDLKEYPVALRQTAAFSNNNQAAAFSNDNQIAAMSFPIALYPLADAGPGFLWRTMTTFGQIGLGGGAAGAALYGGLYGGRYLGGMAFNYVKNYLRNVNYAGLAQTALTSGRPYIAAAQEALVRALDSGVASATSRLARTTGLVGLEAQTLGELASNAASLGKKAAWLSAVYIGLNSVASLASVASVIIDLVQGGSPSPEQIAAAVVEALQPAFEQIFSQLQVLQESVDQISRDIKQVLAAIEEGDCKNRLNDPRGPNAIYDDVYNYFHLQLYIPLYTSATAIQDNLARGEPYVPDSALTNSAKFADAVLNGKDTYRPLITLMRTLHDSLMGTPGGGAGVLETCARAKLDAFRANMNQGAAGVGGWAFDDRQVYNTVLDFLAKSLFTQSLAMRMIEEACTYMAVEEVKKAARQRNITIDIGQLDYICTFATSGNQAGPIQAGKIWCQRANEYRKLISDNMVAQIEFLGQPYSFGDFQGGNGTRLLLGTDVTGIVSRDKYHDTPYASQTTWLLSASPKSFDPTCEAFDYPANVNPDGLNNSPVCAPLGKAQSCGTGCGLHPAREAMWGDLDYPLGYPSSAWQPAGKETWKDIWGIAVTTAPNVADILKYMEQPATPYGANYPFSGITFSPYWIVNDTQTMKVMNLAFPYTENTNDACDGKLKSDFKPECKFIDDDGQQNDNMMKYDVRATSVAVQSDNPSNGIYLTPADFRSQFTRYTCNYCVVKECYWFCATSEIWTKKTTKWNVEQSLAMSPFVGPQKVQLRNHKEASTPDDKWEWAKQSGAIRMPWYDNVLPIGVDNGGLQPWLDQTFFRLPALNISDLKCTVSPYSNTTRSPINVVGVPTQCGDDMTRTIAAAFQSVDFQTDIGNATVVHVGYDGHTRNVTCSVDWDPSIDIVHMEFSISLREGPVFSNETYYNDGKRWEESVVTFQGVPNVTVNIRSIFNGARAYPFIVSCVAIGAHPTTLLPGVAPSQSMVFVGPGQWHPYANATFPPGPSGQIIKPVVCSDYDDTEHITTSDELTQLLYDYTTYGCSGKTIVIDGSFEIGSIDSYNVYGDLTIIASTPGSVNFTDYTLGQPLFVIHPEATLTLSGVDIWSGTVDTASDIYFNPSTAIFDVEGTLFTSNVRVYKTASAPFSVLVEPGAVYNASSTSFYQVGSLRSVVVASGSFFCADCSFLTVDPVVSSYTATVSVYGRFSCTRCDFGPPNPPDIYDIEKIGRARVYCSHVGRLTSDITITYLDYGPPDVKLARFCVL